MPKMPAIRSQVRPWGVRGPRLKVASRKRTVKSRRTYLACMQFNVLRVL